MNKKSVTFTSTVLMAFALLVVPSTSDKAFADKIFQDAIQKCKLELNINEVDAQILQNNKQLPANEVQSCYIECIAKKIGHIKDGKFNHENFINFNKNRFEDNKEKLDEAEKLFQKCQPEVEKKINEKCGAGTAMRSCVIQFFNRTCEFIYTYFSGRNLRNHFDFFDDGMRERDAA